VRQQTKGTQFLKGYAVFNVELIEGLPAHYYAKADEPRKGVTRIEQADAFFAAPVMPGARAG
jgi:antirestriction protein ArdC